MIQAGKVDHGVVHFSERFPVVRTLCGRVAPSAALWRYVSCLECLDLAPHDSRIRARRREVVGALEEAERPL